jgi:hypothetical protein
MKNYSDESVDAGLISLFCSNLTLNNKNIVCYRIIVNRVEVKDQGKII